MSEPVIKAKAWMCGRCHNELGMTPQEIGCFNCHCRRRNDPTPDMPLYGPDALVLAVLAGIAHGAGEGLAFVEMNPGDIAEANAIVDRLTKGDV